jgi:preprotein translocase subunit SecE
MFERLKKFLKEVRIELGKVTWPTASELRGSTGVVIATVLIFTVFIGLVNYGLERIVGLLLR